MLGAPNIVLYDITYDVTYVTYDLRFNFSTFLLIIKGKKWNENYLNSCVYFHIIRNLNLVSSTTKLGIKFPLWGELISDEGIEKTSSKSS